MNVDNSENFPHLFPLPCLVEICLFHFRLNGISVSVFSSSSGMCDLTISSLPEVSILRDALLDCFLYKRLDRLEMFGCVSIFYDEDKYNSKFSYWNWLNKFEKCYYNFYKNFNPTNYHFKFY